MEKFTEILSQRTAPGLILFDSQGKVRYVSQDACELIPSLRWGTPGMGEQKSRMPSELVGFVDQMVKSPVSDDPFQAPFLHTAVISSSWGLPLSLRGFLLTTGEKGDGNHQYLVLVEMIAENRETNLRQIQKRHGLTDRETEVLEQVLAGCSNQAISEKLFISPHTVKDHIRSLKTKLNVSSRNLLLATVKNR